LDKQSTTSVEHNTQSGEQQEDKNSLNDQHDSGIAAANKQAHLHKQAQTQLTHQQWQHACETFELILQDNPQDEDALLGMAEALDKSNRFEALEDSAQRLLELHPNSAPALAYRARALQKLGKISAATISNDQALLLDTHLGLAWINRGGLQLVQGKFPEALRSAQRAIGLAPDDARAWANYGVALFNFNRLGEALEVFDHCLSLDGQQLFALQMKGELLCRIGRMKEAVPVVQRALHLNPNDPTILTQGIQAVRTLELYDSLKDLSLTLTKLTPANVFAWENYVSGLRGLGQFSAANEALDQLLTLDSSNVRYWMLKADTLFRLERYREAVNISDRALRIDPDYYPAQRIHEKSLRMMYQRKEKKHS
jgi:tetratricopeptide (TPR) repeat protein